MIVDIEAEFHRQMLIEQLKKHGIYDNEGYTHKELVRKLEVARAMEVKVQSPHSSWF